MSNTPPYRHGQAQYQQPPYNPNVPPPLPGWNNHQQQQQINGNGFAPPPQVHVYVVASAMKRDNCFDDRSIRACFIRNVFMILTVQLAFVTTIVSLAVFHNDTILFVRRNYALYYLSYIVFFVFYIAIMGCERVRRSFPSNVIAIGILTIAIGYMTMMITAVYSTNTVFMALVITVVSCVSMILFACQTKYDMTSNIGCTLIALMIVIVVGIVAFVATVTFDKSILYFIYLAFPALLFMFCLVINLKMIMNRRNYQVSPDDYIFAALQVYMPQCTCRCC